MSTPVSAPPRVLAVLPGLIPSTIISIVKPLTSLHRLGKVVADIGLEYLISRARVARANVIVFCRNMEPAHNSALRWAIELGKPIIYDLDDNLFETPLSAAWPAPLSSPERMTQLHEYVEKATQVRVYSEQLGDKVREINTNVERVDGPLDWSLVPTVPLRRDPRAPVRIVYATSRIHDDLADLFLDDVERLLAKYRGGVELHFWGYRSDRLARHPSVRHSNYIANYDRFFHKFSRSGYDIGLAPLRDDAFHLSKSNNKFREYAACRIAGIYSAVRVYSECVEHGVTGWLVDNRPGAWYDAMVRLVEDADLRHRIQAQAQDYARRRYGMDKFCAVWLAQILSLCEERLSVNGYESATPRTLIADSAESFERIVVRAARLARRLPQEIRAHGFRRAIHLVRLTLSDWFILFGLRFRSS